MSETDERFFRVRKFCRPSADMSAARVLQRFSNPRLIGSINHGCAFSTQQVFPKVAGTKPIRIELQQNESLWWCSCGGSKDQPQCDGMRSNL